MSFPSYVLRIPKPFVEPIAREAASHAQVVRHFAGFRSHAVIISNRLTAAARDFTFMATAVQELEVRVPRECLEVLAAIIFATLGHTRAVGSDYWKAYGDFAVKLQREVEAESKKTFLDLIGDIPG